MDIQGPTCEADTYGQQTLTHMLRSHMAIPFKSLFDQFLGAGVCGGQDALIMRSLTDLIPKDLQDSWSCDLIGQLGWVVRS